MALSFWESLKRRKIYKVATVYAITAWAIIEVANATFAPLHIPEWTLTFIIVFVLIGFPIALVIAYFFEIVDGSASNNKGIPVEAPSTTRLAWKKILLVSSGFILAGLLTFATYYFQEPEKKVNGIAEKSIAVLPVENISGDKEQDYFSNGMMDEILDQLFKIRGLKVTSRRSSMVYSNSKLTTREIARKLGVSTILEYNVQKSGNMVRITARLIEAQADQQLWSGKYERNFKDVFLIQKEISLGIAKALKVRFSQKEEWGVTSPTENTEAYDLYLKGKFFLNSEQPADIDTSIVYFKRALELDPYFLHAYTELSWAYGIKNFWFDPNGGWDVKAFVAAENAIRLDSVSAEAIFVRAFANWTFKNNFPHENVIQEYKRALKINPNLHRAHTQLGLIYMHLGLLPEAFEEARLGSKMDPYDGFSKITVPSVYFYWRQDQKALDGFTELPDAFLGFGFRVSLRALALINLGRDKEAQILLSKELKTKPDEPSMNGALAVLLARRGDKTNALKAIDRVVNSQTKANHFHHASYSVAEAYAIMNDREQSLYWLRWSAEHGMPSYLFFKDDRLLENLNDYEPFKILLNELKAEKAKYGEIAAN